MVQFGDTLKELEKVLKVNEVVKKVDVCRLTGPGENYLSLVLKVDFQIERNGSVETIAAVAKRLPLKLMGMQEFNRMAMKAELDWYSQVVPIIKTFIKGQRLNVVDVYPEYYGSRYNLANSGEEVDENCVLLLENLIPQGYITEDRHIGFDLATSKAVLKSLAAFHAVPIIMKSKDPKSFEIIKETLDKNKPKPPGRPPGTDGEGKKDPFNISEGRKNPFDVLLDELAKMPEFAEYMPKIDVHRKKKFGPDPSFMEAPKEPLGTVVHNDFWVNNMLIKPGDPLMIKIVDFQMCTYGTYAKDVVFFLLLSVINDVLVEHCDTLLRYYYDEFTSLLKQAEVPWELSLAEYEEDIKFAAKSSQALHALSFSLIVMGSKDTAIDATVDGFDPMEHFPQMVQNMNQAHKNKLITILSEAKKRDWL